MTPKQVQAASNFWATGPGKAVMERWPVECSNSDGNTIKVRWDEPDWLQETYLSDGYFADWVWIEDATAVHTIHGHYLEMLQQWAESRGLGVGLIWPIPDDRRFNICIPLDDGGSALNVVEPTLHEALAAAMDVAFGENDEREKKNGMV